MDVVRIRFYLDRETGEPHVLEHGVEEYEVDEALQRSEEDRRGRDGVRVAIGRTEAGRAIRVIYVPDPEGGSVFVLTAYEVTGKPLVAYRRRRRRRRR